MNYYRAPDIRNIVKQALKEDVGRGDITTKRIIPEAVKITAVIIAGEKGILAGIDIAGSVFKAADKRIRWTAMKRDGERIKPKDITAKIYGPAAGILSAERTALNFLSFLSGIATRTNVFVEKIRPFHAKILDTRKTLPGLRQLEKYAVRVGGGYNHRLGLYDMVLIKENHIDASGHKNIPALVNNARNNIPGRVSVEIEARNLREFKEALRAKPDIIMLDNMPVKNIKEAVALRNASSRAGRPRLEASGNIKFNTIRSYAATGVDFISLGTLTKDVHALDFSLEVK